LYITITSNLEAVDELLINTEVVITELRKKLLKAQATMKRIADTKHIDVNFKEGDWVMVGCILTNNPLFQGTHASYSKLAKRYYDPY